jgi:hypothetical protein
MEIFVGHAEVKSTDVFDARSLYRQLHDWLVEQDYASYYDPYFPEKLYWETRPQTGGAEYWIWWRPVKEGIEGNTFWRRVITIDLHGVGITNVEIMYQGKKLKVNKGKFEVILDARLEIDIGGKWMKSWLMKPLLEPFWKRIYYHEIEMHKKEVKADLAAIQDLCKKFFIIGTRTAMPAFHPSKGYEQEPF